jgi:hypothetical protein
MSVSSLKILRDKRDVLLLAEVAGLLHDWQKCIDMAVASQWFKNRSLAETSKPSEWKSRGSHLKPNKFADALSSISLQIDSNSSIDLKTLCEEGRNPSSAKNHPNQLVVLLGKCHAEAHVEKELGEQEQPDTACDWISTAFGFENVQPEGLLQPLLDKVLPLLTQISYSNRTNLLSKIQEVFSNAWGDTRRPINEVTLWDWGYSVAGLYKSLVAAKLIQVNTSRWRLLRVNFDVLGLYAKAVKIGDLLGYKRAVEQACEAVKKLIEEEYPLGNEIYRDSTGIYFIFPDLDLLADLAQEIRRRVEETEMELAPRIDVTVGDGKTAAEQLKGILAKARREALQDLARPFDGQNLGDYWHQRWKKVGDGKWEVCPVCRLRPKREDRDICEICKKRRASRIKEWGQNPEQTIWIDEIADHNDRVALIVGKFGLDDWLSGDLVQTMLVKAVSGNPKDCVPKNPSPARLRRVWKTCQRFWTETVVEEILTSHPYGQGTPDSSLRRARWRVVPDQTTGWEEHGPYDGTVDGRPISLFWRAQFGDFITIINLQLSGALQRGQRVTVSDPDNPRRIWSFTVQEATPSDDEFGTYQPFLVLLASPDQFLALVPAIDALEIAERIRAEYVRQFGKVQNRLPLFLGLIFFPRKTPLTAVMEAARRMLNTPFKEERWTIQKVTNNTIEFANDVEWNVPVVMGDNVTEDLWYPYFFLETQGNPGRQYCFQLRREGDTDPQKVGSVSAKYADRWLVHVRDLRQGDGVQVTPSRFAYLFLESTARRFRFDPEKDGMLLDELPRLRKMWQDLKESGITNTALNGLWALLERKRAAWGAESKELEKLAEDALKDAGLFQRKDPQGNPPRDLVRPDDVRNGRFVRCLELHMYILKQKITEA